jgi:5'-nucleotidase
VPVGAPRGVKLTRLGVRRYTEGVIEEKDPRNRQIFWIGGGDPVWEAIPDTDFHELGNGYVSVTPLHLDMTDRGFLAELEQGRPRWLDGVRERG